MLTSWSLLFATTKYCVSIHHWKKKSDQHSKICTLFEILYWQLAHQFKRLFKLSAIQRNGTQSNKDMKCDAWDFQIGNWPSQNEHGILWSSSFFFCGKFLSVEQLPAAFADTMNLNSFKSISQTFFFKAAFSKFWFIFPPYI